MKKVILFLGIFITIAASGNLPAQDQPAYETLQEGFVSPPPEAKPRTWWHWTGSNITREGITKDLEWMARVGIGGFMLFDVSLGMGQTIEDKKVVFTPEWFEILKYATTEAERLGLEMTMHSSAGWSETGGPWVKPEEAVKKLVWSETQVEGGRRFSGQLPTPPSVIGPIRDMPQGGGFGNTPMPSDPIYVDARVIAFPAPASESGLEKMTPNTSSNFGDFNAAALLDESLQTTAAIPKPSADKPSWIQYEYAEPVTVRAFSLALKPAFWASSAMRPGYVEYSEDGQTFKPLVALPGPQHDIRGLSVRTFSFPAATARYFRITFVPGSGITTVGGPDEGRFANPDATTFEVMEARFHSGARVHRWEDKANFTPLFEFEAYPTPAVPEAAAIPGEEVIDLTGRLAADGTLSWEAPPGRWTILRMGYSLTGAQNGPAVPEGTGLEADKLNKEHLESYYYGFTDRIKETLGDLYGKRLQYYLVDSYEADAQNWTDDILPEFEKRRGYNPMPYLPALAGRVVESAEVSDRFLWDFRRTIADLLAEEHYEAFAELAHAQGIKVYSEAAGISLPVIQDALLNKSKVDIPMGEFGMTQGLSVAGSEWRSAEELRKIHAYRGAGDRMNAHWADVREAASAVHIYGKKFVAAESWTGGGFEAPADLQPIGDYWNTQGINRFIFHTSTHQPLDTKPGNAMVGAHFHRNITWAEQARPFMDYVARNSYLLQQGRFVGDIAYFLGESIPSAVPYWKNLNPMPAEGYDYDFINTEILLEEMKVENGRLVLDNGMTYEVLVLPDSREMTPHVLDKIRQLVQDGATVVGPQPLRSPSLKGYPVVDEQVLSIAEEMWGDCDGELIFHQAYGAGHIYWGVGLEGILAEKQVAKDLEYTRPNFDTKLNWIHRRAGDTDFYFISNQRDQPENVRIRFRVSGKKPERWNPVNGQIEPVSYEMDGEFTTVSLTLETKEAVFIVFGKPTDETSFNVPDKEIQIVQKLEGPWQIEFMPDLGAPGQVQLDKLASWPQHPDEGVKYYSGTATYNKSFNLSDGALGQDASLLLNLGQVGDLAEVFVNGQRMDLLWKPPYRTNITDALVPGENRLEIKVTNQWNNRIQGDRALPADQKILSGSGFSFGGGGSSPLENSGLIGPVTIEKVEQK